jgi:hypothetical protein
LYASAQNGALVAPFFSSAPDRNNSYIIDFKEKFKFSVTIDSPAIRPQAAIAL